MAMNKEVVGIVVGGGPAPGINGVISAVTIEAINHGKKVVGIVGGFNALFDGNDNAIVPLTIDDVSRIHNTGGSILRTSRGTPEEPKEKFKTLMAMLKRDGYSGHFSLEAGASEEPRRVIAIYAELFRAWLAGL